MVRFSKECRIRLPKFMIGKVDRLLSMPALPARLSPLFPEYGVPSDVVHAFTRAFYLHLKAQLDGEGLLNGGVQSVSLVFPYDFGVEVCLVVGYRVTDFHLSIESSALSVDSAEGVFKLKSLHPRSFGRIFSERGYAALLSLTIY